MKDENLDTSPSPEIWRYHTQPMYLGRPLFLLSWKEFLNPRIRALIVRNVDALANDRKVVASEMYSHMIRHHRESRERAYLDFNAALRKFPMNDKRYVEFRDEVDFHSLNRTLNTIFSDNGWRKIRSEISQIEKRNKTKRVQLSTDVCQRLTAFKTALGLESMDAAVLTLLDDWLKFNSLEEIENDE